jgi:aspartyl-tRNA(Asn)/glutamyl-tRNA(Gln) amidotransferase subunit C
MNYAMLLAMSQLTSDQVRHIAKLARLHLTDDEVQRFSKELGEILTYVDMLKEVKTDDVEPTAQVTGLKNMHREDDICDTTVKHEDLLSCSQLPIVENQIKTPSAHG